MRKTNERMSFLQMVLTVLFVSALLISNVITSKQVLLPFDIVMTGAVFIFPITYILSDLFSEIYGYKYSRRTCYLAFAMNLFMVVVFQLVIETTPPAFWNNQQAFETVLGNTPRVLIASLAAFMIGDYINDRVFKKLKEKHPKDHKGFGFRAIASSFCGELIDSLVFLPIAFIGQMPVTALIEMTIMQVLIKTGYEIVILPVTKYIVKVVSAYESKAGDAM